MINFEVAEWDSKFFECNVLSVHQAYPEPRDTIEITGIVESYQPDLVYVFAFEHLTMNIPGYNVVLVDQKKTYLKSKLLSSTVPESIKRYGLPTVSEQLLKLTFQSGNHSRFKIDPWFTNDQFEALYQLWIEGSVNGKLASEVLIYPNEEDIEGFITLKLKDESGSVELIAVDEHHRGTGIGKLLMQSAENWCIDNNLEQLLVITQEDNIGACKFYEHCGFNPVKLEFVYHLHKL